MPNTKGYCIIRHYQELFKEGKTTIVMQDRVYCNESFFLVFCLCQSRSLAKVS